MCHVHMHSVDIDIDYSDNGKTWTIIHWPTEIIEATNHIFRLLRSSAVILRPIIITHFTCNVRYSIFKILTNRWSLK